MKMTPELEKAAEKMKPGVLVKGGLLGSEEQDLATVLADQHAECRRLGVRWETIGEKMATIARTGLQAFGCAVTIDGRWQVCADENRGKLPCPWPHPGMFQKTVYAVKNLNSGVEIQFSELSIHLIARHGFFAGNGTPFYNSPKTLVEVLEIPRDDAVMPVPVPAE